MNLYRQYCRDSRNGVPSTPETRAANTAAAKARRDKNLVAYRARDREYRLRNPAKRKQWAATRAARLRGTPTRPMPPGCECCGRPPSGKKTVLCIDHCHLTGDFRGWLCDACNRGIGLLQEQPARAVEYLRRAYARF
jgi:hypothetical protein